LIIFFETCKNQHFQTAFPVDKIVPEYGTGESAIAEAISKKALACNRAF
jgi:hypothetical protein